MKILRKTSAILLAVAVLFTLNAAALAVNITSNDKISGSTYSVSGYTCNDLKATVNGFKSLINIKYTDMAARLLGMTAVPELTFIHNTYIDMDTFRGRIEEIANAISQYLKEWKTPHSGVVWKKTVRDG